MLVELQLFKHSLPCSVRITEASICKYLIEKLKKLETAAFVMQVEWNLRANLKTFLFKSLNYWVVDKALCRQERRVVILLLKIFICLLDVKARSNSISCICLCFKTLYNTNMHLTSQWFPELCVSPQFKRCVNFYGDQRNYFLLITNN